MKSKRTRNLSDAVLLGIAKRIYDGKILTDRQVKPEELLGVFMPLIFLSKKNMPKDIGLIYADIEIDRALPRGINGMPMFTQMHFLNKANTKRLNEMYSKLKKVRDNEDKLIKGE